LFPIQNVFQITGRAKENFSSGKTNAAAEEKYSSLLRENILMLNIDQQPAPIYRRFRIYEMRKQAFPLPI